MQYLEIAKIVNTHGLLGEVKVLCNYYGQNFTKWKPEQVVYLKNNDDYQPLTISKVRQHKNFLLITFVSYNEINAVLFMKNKTLVIVDEENSENPNFSFQNLMGYQAIDNAKNKVLGKVIALIDNHHTGLWQIETQAGKTFYVPNNQFFIAKVDQNKKIVYLNLIAGMFNYE